MYFSRHPIPYFRGQGSGVGGQAGAARSKSGPALTLSDLTPDPWPLASGAQRLKHIGLYAYRADFLQAFSRMEPTPLEQAEALEQLRALENGERIFVVLIEHDAISVDTPEDLARVRALMERQNG